MMKEIKNKPPIGTANSGYQYETEIKAPFGASLVAELKKIGDRNRAKRKAERDAADAALRSE
jgi:hypothetical protein